MELGASGGWSPPGPYGSGSSSISNSSSSSGTKRDPFSLAAAGFLQNAIKGYKGVPYGEQAWNSLGTGPGGNFPNITTGPIYTPQQTTNMWNATADKGRQAAMSEAMKPQLGISGRGWGSGGLGGAELARRSMSAFNAAQPGAESQFRFGVAGENAQHQLASEQANVARSSAIGQLQAQQQGIYAGGQNALLQAMLGLSQAQPFSQSKGTSSSTSMGGPSGGGGGGGGWPNTTPQSGPLGYGSDYRQGGAFSPLGAAMGGYGGGGFGGGGSSGGYVPNTAGMGGGGSFDPYAGGGFNPWQQPSDYAFGSGQDPFDPSNGFGGMGGTYDYSGY